MLTLFYIFELLTMLSGLNQTSSLSFAFISNAAANLEVPSCPAGTTPIISLIGEVDPALLPRRPVSQGSTPTCDLHPPYFLVNALHRFTKIQQGLSSEQIQDLSIIDMLRNVQSNSSDPYPDSKSHTSIFLAFKGIPVLYNILKNPNIATEIEDAPLTLSEANQLNQFVIDQMKRCESGNCNQSELPHSITDECLHTQCGEDSNLLKSLYQAVDSVNSPISSVNPQIPLLSIIHDRLAIREQIPPYYIKVANQFQSLEEVQKTLIAHFKTQKLLLPMGLAVKLDSFLNFVIFPPVSGKKPLAHALSMTKIEKVSCEDQFGNSVMEFHTTKILDSHKNNYSRIFHFEELTKAIFFAKHPLYSIHPCVPAGGSTPNHFRSGNVENCPDFPIVPIDNAIHQFYVRDPTSLGPLEHLIEKGLDPNATVVKRSGTVMTLLHAAVVDNRASVVKAILAHPKTNPNILFRPIGSSGSHTILMLAIDFADIEILRMLLKHPKMDINQEVSNGYNALYHAFGRQNDKAIFTLLSNPRLRRQAVEAALKSFPNQSNAVTIASELILNSNKSPHMNQKLIRAALRKNNQEFLNALVATSDPTTHRSILLELILQNHFNLFRTLIAASPIDFSELLTLAITKKRDKIIDILLENPQTDINQVDSNGRTPIEVALASQNIPTALKLITDYRLSVATLVKALQKQSNLDEAVKTAAHTFFETRLSKAVKDNNLSLAQEILEYSDVKLDPATTRELLIQAMIQNNLEFFRAFFKKSQIDPNEFLSLAIPTASDEMLETLLSNPRTDVNQINVHGETPIEISFAIQAHRTTLKLLSDSRLSVHRVVTALKKMPKLGPLVKVAVESFFADRISKAIREDNSAILDIILNCSHLANIRLAKVSLMKAWLQNPKQSLIVRNSAEAVWKNSKNGIGQLIRVSYD